LSKINPVARAVVNPEFVDAISYWLIIPQIAETNSLKPCINLNLGFAIS
jgi:hypothetical protein